MLLRIDDIVSGISKKSRGGGGQPSGTQTEDHDNVSFFAALQFLFSALACLYQHDCFHLQRTKSDMHNYWWHLSWISHALRSLQVESEQMLQD